MNISDRLKTVASLITAGNSVADIGTDHGYIPIYLALNDLTKKAVAMDINEGPLSRAADNIQKYNVGSCVETRISDGLCGLAENEVDTVEVDCKELAYISSAGLRVLLMISKLHDVHLINVNDTVKDILSQTGFDQIVKVK